MKLKYRTKKSISLSLFLKTIMVGYSLLLIQFNGQSQSIQYMARLYDDLGNSVDNKPITLKAMVINETIVVYSELHNVVTDGEGHYFIPIGKGSPLVGSFTSINWASNNLFLQTEIDTSGLGNFVAGVPKQFPYLPLALFADSAAEVKPVSFYELEDSPQGNNGGDMLYWQGEWKVLPIGESRNVLELQDSIPVWRSTEQIPEIQTQSINGITSLSANCGGIISSDGGSPIIQKGLCYSKQPNVDINDSILINQAASFTFTMAIFPLQPSTTYYVRAYATNQLGTAYGTEYSFTTIGEPVVTTTAVSNIVYNRATIEGVVVSDGGSSILQCGVCYNTTSSPSINDKLAPATTALGSFLTTVGGLSPVVTYYARAFVRTQAGTFYGNELSFTSSAWSCTDSLTYYHLAANSIAPEDKLVTYGTIGNLAGEPNKCWLTSNFGASRQAVSIDDTSEAAAGWYWQFNRKYGYKNDGSTTTPSTTWLPNILQYEGWLASNDPCNKELGNGWRIPTIAEFGNIIYSNGWLNQPNLAWSSVLKLHYAGYLTPSINFRGVQGHYWVTGWEEYDAGSSVIMYTGHCDLGYDMKKRGLPLRCIKSL